MILLTLPPPLPLLGWFDCVSVLYEFVWFVDVSQSSADDFDSTDDLYEAVGGLLLEASGSEDDDNIRSICKGLMNLLKR